MPEHIILVEDDRELRSFLAEALDDAGYSVGDFATADAALEYLRGGGKADAVITDLIMPGMRGHELLPQIRASRPELNVIIITAFGAIDSAIALVKAGAYDYLTKPFSTDELLLTLERALEESRLRREVARLSRAATRQLPGLVGASRAMQEVYDLVHRAAAAAFPVLITGESGTGKELIARAVHQLSGREGRFVAVNCAALPENLLESELFGHEKGAFTGADRERPGLLETAHRGTLFLDEVTELPSALQPKLLRALEDGEVRRVGASQARRFDVRFVSATNRDIEQQVAEGRFRDDLYWRLHVLHVHLPPLRERPADVPLLTEHFLGSRSIAREAMNVLTAYPWPGNVRELRNALERATAMAGEGEIAVEDLPPRMRDAAGAVDRVADASRRTLPLRELEREYILEVLRQTGGNKSRTADILGLDRKTLYRKLEEYRVAE
jgi:two-component system, NtrC family, response regulator AtoC